MKSSSLLIKTSFLTKKLEEQSRIENNLPHQNVGAVSPFEEQYQKCEKISIHLHLHNFVIFFKKTGIASYKLLTDLLTHPPINSSSVNKSPYTF